MNPFIHKVPRKLYLCKNNFFRYIMAQIPFTVSARTARLIGQENFANADGAIIELVKNGYDADAQNCIIIFDNLSDKTEDHCIYIIDNGVGMTDEIITKYWMMIGTDNKEKSYKTDNGRVKTGAKGIGRFALDRLGQQAKVETISKQTKEACVWEVDWSDFQKPGIALSDVKASLEKVEKQVDFTSYIKDKFPELSALTSLLTQIELSHGTIIKIASLKDLWDGDDIRKLFNNLEVLIPPKEQPDFQIHLFSRIAPEEYGQVDNAYYDDFDYKLSANYLGDENQTVQIKIKRNELSIEKLETEYKEVFQHSLMQKFPYNLEIFQKQEFSFDITLKELVKGFASIDKQGLLEKIGQFCFTFYYIKNAVSDDKSDGDIKKYPYKSFNSANRREWLKKFGGVKIFRDDFRVRPYGENGEDWLKLGERQARSPQGAGQRLGAYRIRPNQVSGTINISRITNVNFQDKSGREGIQENDTFDLFKVIITEIIALFEKDRNTVMFALSELSKQRDKEREEKRKAQELAEEILRREEETKSKKQNQQKEKDNNQQKGKKADDTKEPPSDTEVLLAKHAKAQEEELEEKESELRLLRSLASTGLIVASFAHELRSIRSLLVARTDDLKTSLDKVINKDLLKGLAEEWNPYEMLKMMREQDVKIKHWLDYSLSALKKDKRKRTNLDVSHYFDTFKSNWASALSTRRTEIKLINKLEDVASLRAFTIDFDTVFNNLLANSLDAFKLRKDNTPRVVTITWRKEGERLSIIYEDTGVGLSKDFKNPDDIFLPFVTSKRDKKGNEIGTGMGMYLVKMVIEDYNGNVELMPADIGFKIRLSLPLRKQ
jgi:signal transduction histidine kinase